MAGGARWLTAILLIMFVWAGPLHAQQSPPPPGNTTAAPVTEDAMRLLELGKMLMGQNNPTYAVNPMKLDMAQRNAAGAQALETFRKVVKLYPKYAEGWLWLGIALTETVEYSREAPDGEIVERPMRVAEALQAFRQACALKPDDITCITYCAEAMMVYRQDFDAARKLWEDYLPKATTDMQRMTAYVQAARACLNKAYFGKASRKLPEAQVKQQYLTALVYTQKAATLCPNAEEVKEMQQLLLEHKKSLGQ